MKSALFISFILAVQLCNGQMKRVDFSSVDSHAITVRATSLQGLAKELTSPYNTELEKVRSIFKWITENIQYNVTALHDTADIYKGLFRPWISDIDSIVQKDFHDRVVNKVLLEKIAICDGYARLFKSLCDEAGIQSAIITGRARWYSDPVNSPQTDNHAWNAVRIDNKWRLLDAGWASGYLDDSLSIFIKRFSDFYFLTDPERFIVNHYPADAKWTLLNNPPAMEQFFSLPYTHPKFFSSGIVSFSPAKMITTKKVRIEMETTSKRKDLEILEHPEQKDTSRISVQHLLKKLPSQYKIAGKKIYWDYEIKSDKTERLDIYLNGEPVLSYYVKLNQ